MLIHVVLTWFVVRHLKSVMAVKKNDWKTFPQDAKQALREVNKDNGDYFPVTSTKQLYDPWANTETESKFWRQAHFLI